MLQNDEGGQNLRDTGRRVGFVDVFPYKTTPVLASMTIPASESIEMSDGHSVEASACIGAASRDSKKCTN